MDARLCLEAGHRCSPAKRLILFRQPTFSTLAMYSASESGFFTIKPSLSLVIDASNREIITVENRHYRAAASAPSPSKLSPMTARSPAIITDEAERPVRHNPDRAQRGLNKPWRLISPGGPRGREEGEEGGGGGRVAGGAVPKIATQHFAVQSSHSSSHRRDKNTKSSTK